MVPWILQLRLSSLISILTKRIVISILFKFKACPISPQKPRFAQLCNLCRKSELLKWSQLSCSRSAGAWVSWPLSAWENTIRGMSLHASLPRPDNWHPSEMAWLDLSIKLSLVCLNIQCQTPGMACYIIQLCSYRDRYEASFSALWSRPKTIMWSLAYKKKKARHKHTVTLSLAELLECVASLM